MTLHRCLFAVACCGLLWAVATDDMRKPIEMPPTLRILPGGMPSGTAELHQRGFALRPVCPCVVAAADLLRRHPAGRRLLPAARAQHRRESIAGGWVEIAMAVFAATAAAGLPQLLRTIGYLAQDPIGKTEEESK